MKYSIRPMAREDILRQFRYYVVEKDAEGVAERFLAAVQQAIEELCLHPEMGARRMIGNPALQGLRTWPVGGFSAMRVYYLCDEDTLRVVRVLHGRRDIDPMLEDDEGPF